MAEYTVTWSIDITADTPIEAAKEARLAQQDPFSEGLYFEVYPLDSNCEPDGNVIGINLLEDE